MKRTTKSGKGTLEEEIKSLNKTLHQLVRQRSLPYVFLTGIVTALGSLIGATVLVAVIGYILSKLHFLPFVAFILQNLPKR